MVFRGVPDDGQQSRLTDGHRGRCAGRGMTAMGIADAVAIDCWA
jgi:hypothetical protein